MTLTDAYAVLKSGTLWSSTAKCKGYAVQNPGEAAKIDAYVAALTAGQTPAPPVLATATGRGLVGMLAALATATPPPPTPEPYVLPVGGLSPGGMFRPSLSVFAREMQQYIDIAAPAVNAGKRMMLRVDYEDTIQPCLDNGFDVLMVVGGTIRGFANLPGGSVGAYASICAGIASRWKGKTGKNGARLAILEVGGNEPNMNGISPAQEVQILKTATPAIKAADSTLLVAMGGLAPAPDALTLTKRLRAHTRRLLGRVEPIRYAAIQAGNQRYGATSYSPRTYMTQMVTSTDPATKLAPGDLDVYPGHMYGDALARGTWNTWDQTFPYGTFPAGTTIRELLDSHGMADVIIMSGESGRPDSSATVVADGFAEFRRRRDAGEKIGPFLIFTMRSDWITLGVDSKYGMLNLDWTHRPAWSAAQTGIAGT